MVYMLQLKAGLATANSRYATSPTSLPSLIHPQRRSTMVLPTSPRQARGSTATPPPSEFLDLPALFERRKALLDGLLKGFPSKALKLFVVVSPMLNEADYRRIAPSLWENGLMDTVDASTTASVRHSDRSHYKRRLI